MRAGGEASGVLAPSSFPHPHPGVVRLGVAVPTFYTESEGLGGALTAFQIFSGESDVITVEAQPAVSDPRSWSAVGSRRVRVTPGQPLQGGWSALQV